MALARFDDPAAHLGGTLCPRWPTTSGSIAPALPSVPARFLPSLMPSTAILARFLRHTWRTLGMFTFHGDETDRYNLDGRPVFDWFNGLFFYLGLILVLLRLRRSADLAGPAALLLLWLFFMLLPGFITDDSPTFCAPSGRCRLSASSGRWAWTGQASASANGEPSGKCGE